MIFITERGQNAPIVKVIRGVLSFPSKKLMETHLERYLRMILSLNEKRTPQVLMKCFFNEGLVIFDKEMQVFL